MLDIWSPLFPAVAVVATLWGGMVFFAAVMAPLVFMKLPGETAGPFIRAVFPVYYMAGTATALVAAAALMVAMLLHAAPDGLRWDGAALAATALGFEIARRKLMPAINRYRDRELAGDAAASKPFARLHRLSVVLNLVQMVVVLIVLARLANAA